MSNLRSPESQKIHDQVIQSMPDMHKNKFQVFLNPGDEKNISICNNLYPDCIIKENDAIKYVLEVETKETLLPSKIPSWEEILRCAASLGAEFYLVVPIGNARDAISLCESHGCKYKFGVYEVIEGKIDLTFQK